MHSGITLECSYNKYFPKIQYKSFYYILIFVFKKNSSLFCYLSKFLLTDKIKWKHKINDIYIAFIMHFLQGVLII